jgi:hypothetical protein
LIRSVALVIVLAGCAATPAPPPPVRPVCQCQCPPSVAVPAPLSRVHTLEQLNAFAIALEVAREAERARGDACARTVLELRGMTP